MVLPAQTGSMNSLTTPGQLDTSAPSAVQPAAVEVPGKLQLSSGVVLRALLCCLAAVTALHLMVVVSYAQGHDIKGAARFYFDNEGNLPSYFSTFIIFLSAVLLSVISAFKHTDKDRFFRHWLVMSLLFFAMALDEALSFHELLIDPLRAMFGFSGLMRFSWIVVGALFVLGFAVAYLPFLAHLNKTMRWLFLASGVVYVGGAIGFEMASGPYYEVYESGGNSLPYMVLMTIEELLEMSGILLFIHTLLTYLKAYKPAFSVRLS